MSQTVKLELQATISVKLSAPLEFYPLEFQTPERALEWEINSLTMDGRLDHFLEAYFAACPNDYDIKFTGKIVEVKNEESN